MSNATLTPPAPYFLEENLPDMFAFIGFTVYGVCFFTAPTEILEQHMDEGDYAAHPFYMLMGLAANLASYILALMAHVELGSYGHSTLTTIAFATLDSRFRTESAALFALVRSVGSSIGISGVATMMHENTQTSHADIVSHITPFSKPLQALAPDALWSLNSGERGLAALAGEINKQAAMVAYVSVFQMMAYMVLAAMPIVLLLKPVKKSAIPKKIEMAVEA